MKLRNLLYLLLIVPILFVNTGCSKDEDPVAPEVKINEAQVLAEYLEANGDFINTTSAPPVVGADVVRNLQLSTPAKLHIIDIRTAADFTAKGRIEGAVQVDLKNIITYMKGLTNWASYDRIVITCYSGQSASYAASMLRLLGYNNVWFMKFGMTAWNKEVQDSWSSLINNSNFNGMVTTPFTKAAKGTFPVINTGKKTGKEILEARITELLSTTNPFGDVTVNWATASVNLGNYYIVNYWADADYNKGHLPNAIQYVPRSDLKISTNLLTLPTNKPILFYCYTGQTSATVGVFLKLLGYDVKSLTFGVNSINHTWMGANSISNRFSTTDVYNYPYVK